MVRVRAVHISPADKSDAVPALGIPSDAITVSSKTIPEFDISYFFTKNIAAELVLTYPQKHDVMLSGTKIGSLKELPPTLTLQYHFLPNEAFNPYLGIGINYTNVSSVDLPGGLSLDHHSWGAAVQAGLDYRLDKNWSLNIDIKKVQMRSDLSAGGNTISTVKVDPVLFGLGIGYRF